MRPSHIVNVETRDTHEGAEIGANIVLGLVQQVGALLLLVAAALRESPRGSCLSILTGKTLCRRCWTSSRSARSAKCCTVYISTEDDTHSVHFY